MTSLYEADFYAWANQQAALLRAGKLSSADIAHIAEEIASMGKSEKRELVNQLTVLLLHLLKWRFQPSLRGNSWRYTIKVQRRDLARHLDHNPSLRAQLAPVLADAYASAVLMAAGEPVCQRLTFRPSARGRTSKPPIRNSGRTPPTDAFHRGSAPNTCRPNPGSSHSAPKGAIYATCRARGPMSRRHATMVRRRKMGSCI